MQNVSIWDELGADGQPRFANDHPRLDAAERSAVTQYLESGAVVAATTERRPDVLAPGAPQLVVPQHFRTDGDWVWNDEVTYYVGHHGLAPHQPFLGYLRERNFVPPEVNDRRRKEALRFLVGPGPRRRGRPQAKSSDG